ncbi:MAG: cation:proton antiporter [bacterium]|nr:cation:proton antiporter [bacterium]
MMDAVVVASTVLPSAAPLILIGLGAFTLPLIAGRLKLPAVVLELVFGLLIGPVFLLVETGTSDAEFIELLAELGLLLLMFLAGFEIDFERLERQGTGPLITGALLFGAFLVAAWFGFGLLDPASTNERVFLTLLTSAASLGIVIPALRATGRSGTRQGQLTLVTAIIAEFGSATAIVFFGVIVESGGGWRLLSVPALFATMGGVLGVMRQAAWWYPERFERLFAHDDPDELGIRASLALLLVFVGISVALGVEAILGAFLAGALFAYVFRNIEVLETRLTGFSYGFFIPVFFINVGIGFPLSELGEPGVLTKALGLIGIAIAIKVGPSMLLALRGLSLRESLGAGVLLTGQLSVIIALAEFGVEIGVLDEGLEAGAILLVGVTAILSPIVFRALSPPLETTNESVDSTALDVP